MYWHFHKLYKGTNFKYLIYLRLDVVMIIMAFLNRKTCCIVGNISLQLFKFNIWVHNDKRESYILSVQNYTWPVRKKVPLFPGGDQGVASSLTKGFEIYCTRRIGTVSFKRRLDYVRPFCTNNCLNRWSTVASSPSPGPRSRNRII